MANEDAARRAGKGCAATLGLLIAMVVGCIGGATVGLFIGMQTHVDAVLFGPEIWMTLLGALLGPTIVGAAYFFIAVVFWKR